MKICTKCKIEKTLDCFILVKPNSNKYRSPCRDCMALSRRENNIKVIQRNLGHILKSKICANCKIDKDVIYFSKHNIRGYQSICKDCEKEYRQNNKEHRSQQQKQWRQNNIDKCKENHKQWNSANKEYKKELDSKYYKENKDHIIKKNNGYVKNRKLNDPSYKLRKNISHSFYHYLRRIGKSKSGQSCMEYIDYTIEELREHLRKQFEPWMSWNNQGVYNSKTWKDDNTLTWTWNIDHIIPQSKFDWTSKEEIKKCWSLNNLRPYSAKQNILDGNRRDFPVGAESPIPHRPTV